MAMDSIAVYEKLGTEFNWMNVKSSSVEHLLPTLKAFSVYNLKVGGNKSIVNAIGKRDGPSWRMVVEVGTPMKAYGVYPGGQSGNPGSAYYKNFIDTWVEGNYYELLFMKDKESDSDKIIHKQKMYK
jgi:penicillin amidase